MGKDYEYNLQSHKLFQDIVKDIFPKRQREKLS